MLRDNWFRTRDLVSQRPGEPLIFHRAEYRPLG
jgi:hypothetical protein